MIEFRYYCLHVRPNLFRRPMLVCHMFYTKIYQLFFAGILEFAIRVAPLTLFFIEITILLSTNGGIIERHTATLANQLSR